VSLKKPTKEKGFKQRPLTLQQKGLKFALLLLGRSRAGYQSLRVKILIHREPVVILVMNYNKGSVLVLKPNIETGFKEPPVLLG